MKKWEEMMELLTDELAGFDNSVKKLETLCKNLDTIKVKADSSNIEYRLKEFLEEQQHRMNWLEKQLGEQQTQIGASRGLPKWLLTLYAIGMLLPLFAIGYFGYQGYNLQEQKRQAFEQGQNQIIERFTWYFDERPEAYEAYREWKETTQGVPSKQ